MLLRVNFIMVSNVKKNNENYAFLLLLSINTVDFVVLKNVSIFIHMSVSFMEKKNTVMQENCIKCLVFQY